MQPTGSLSITTSRRQVILTGALGLGAMTAGLVNSKNAAAESRHSPSAEFPHPPKGQTNVNVIDHGAVGDGVTDDYAAFSSAMQELADAGGGKLIIPPRTYVVNSGVLLADNVHIYSTGAVLTKTVASEPLFMSLSDQKQGYGSGVRRVKAEGLTFRGDFAAEITFCSFALHHAQDVIVENCTFIQTQRTGHCLDLCGCRRVAVRNCTFRGFNNTATSGYNKTEAIQLDQSRVHALSFADSPESYDALFTRDVWVEDCQFLPEETASAKYPCPNPVGAHSSREAHHFDNVTFANNVVVDPQPDPSTPELDEKNIHSSWKGVIHFPTIKNLKIINNSFTQAEPGSVRAISLFSIDVSDQDAVPPSEYPVSGPVDPIATEHVLIKGNHFEGFCPGDDDPPQEVIWIRGVPGGEARHITISNNVLQTERTTDGRGTVAVRLLHCRDVAIRNNHILDSAGGTRLEHTESFKITSNEITVGEGGDLPIGIDITQQSDHGRVTGNSISGFSTPVSTAGAGTDIVVSGNN